MYVCMYVCMHNKQTYIVLELLHYGITVLASLPLHSYNFLY